MILRCALTAVALLTAGPTLADSPALAWLTAASERQGIWRKHGDITFPTKMLFVGDPTWGDDYHIRDPRQVPSDTGTLYTFEEPITRRNYLIWIAFTNEMPVATGETLGFGIDAATIGLGAFEGGQALVDLGERYIDQGKGDSHSFILPHIDQPKSFAKWLPIPGSAERIFLVFTGNDGGSQATWLVDVNGDTSGILIDITGRASDGRYLDKLLPAQ